MKKNFNSLDIYEIKMRYKIIKLKLSSSYRNLQSYS